MPLVLIVDDNEQNRKLARDVLDAGGFWTIEAATGAAAIALAREQAPDLILMDLRLPDLDGTEVARQLSGVPATARIPVVAMSASRLEADADRLRGAGFAGYIEKPIRVREFPELVRRFCAPAQR